MTTTKVYVRDYGPNRKFLVLVWRDPVTGMLRTQSSKCTRRREAERAAAAKEAELNAVQPTGDGDFDWDSFILHYRDSHLVSLAPASQKRSLSVLNTFAVLMRPATLASITTPVLTQFANKLRAKGRSEATIATSLATIRAALAWAHDEGHTRGVPKIPKTSRAMVRRSKGRPLTNAEFARMLRAVRDVVPRPHRRSWRQLLRGLWLSGLRIEEAMLLSWDDRSAFWIELDSGPYPLLGVNGEYEKGKQDRLLPLTEDFGRWLLRTPPKARRGFVFNPGKLRHRQTRNPEHASRVITEIGAAAKIVVNSRGKTASAHDLRRSFGLRWAQRMFPADLQHLMRHANISTTMTYYVTVSATELAAKLWKTGTTPGTTPVRES